MSIISLGEISLSNSNYNPNFQTKKTYSSNMKNSYIYSMKSEFSKVDSNTDTFNRNAAEGK